MGKPLSTTELAPRWHTALLIALFVAVAALGALLQHRGAPVAAPPSGAGRAVGVYLPMLVVQWSLALYVCRVGRAKNALSALLGARWNSARRALTDLALAALGWALIRATELAWGALFDAHTAASVTAMLPHTAPERLMWALVALSVGFCEELIFRGYLLTQLEAFTGSAALGVALQAALFGLAHGEQGVASAARIALYGLGLGALARARRSLLPGIVCHVSTDLVSGLLG